MEICPRNGHLKEEVHPNQENMVEVEEKPLSFIHFYNYLNCIYVMYHFILT